MPVLISLPENEIIDMYISNKFTISDICLKFNVSKFKIRKVLLSNNIKSKSSKKYNYYDSIFENIDSEEKAYWLGFLYADGYVRVRKSGSELRLKLSIKDKDHLLKFKKFISPDDIPVVYEEYKKSKSYKISISSKKIVKDLINKGCINKKSLLINQPVLLDNLQSHFIRGYFDGDGWISLNKKGYFSFGICSGSEDMIKSLQSIVCNKCNISPNKLYPNKNTKCFSFIHNSSTDIVKIANYLYKESSIFLERKKINFDVLKNDFNN